MTMLGDIDALFTETDAVYTVGIMGGTFNPVHTGHLYCAEQALDVCGLDAVAFMPAGNPSFKQDQRLASIDDRMRMCELATFSNPKFSVSAAEAREEGVTYSVDTLRRLRDAYPENVRFEFIVGTDSLLTLKHWHESDTLASLCGFICVGRPGVPGDGSQGEAVEAEIAREMELLQGNGFRIRLIDVPLLDISSSDIRQRLREGRSIRYLAPLPVCDYIDAKNLYRS